MRITSKRPLPTKFIAHAKDDAKGDVVQVESYATSPLQQTASLLQQHTMTRTDCNRPSWCVISTGNSFNSCAIFAKASGSNSLMALLNSISTACCMCTYRIKAIEPERRQYTTTYNKCCLRKTRCYHTTLPLSPCRLVLMYCSIYPSSLNRLSDGHIQYTNHFRHMSATFCLKETLCRRSPSHSIPVSIVHSHMH